MMLLLNCGDSRILIQVWYVVKIIGFHRWRFLSDQDQARKVAGNIKI